MSTYTGDATLTAISTQSGFAGNDNLLIYTVPANTFAIITNISFDPAAFGTNPVYIEFGGKKLVDEISGGEVTTIRCGWRFEGNVLTSPVGFIGQIIMTTGQQVRLNRATCQFTVREFNTP